MIIFRLKLLLLLVLLSFSSALSLEQQIEVTDFIAKVYLAPNPNSKVVGLIQKGERYTVLNTTGYWYRIEFRGDPVWVDSTKVRSISPNNTPAPSADNNIDQQHPVSNNANNDVANTNNDTVAKQQNQSHTTVPANKTIDSVPVEQRNTSVTESKRVVDASASAASRVQESIAQDSKMKRWLSRQSLSKLPIIEQNVEEQRKDKFFLVTTSPTKILLQLSPDSPILGLVNRGQHLKLIGEGDLWCKVYYRDTVGWIEKKNGKIVTSTSFPLLFNLWILFCILGAVLLIFIIVILFKVFNKKKNVNSSDGVKRKVLIIAKDSKVIEATLTNTTCSIEQCFEEIDFNIRKISDFGSVKPTLETFTPDVILVDWRLDRTIISILEKLFYTNVNADSMIFIIYNVPDPTSMFPSKLLKKMSFLGASFTDRDLFKILTPLMSSSDDAQDSKNGIQSSALAGNIEGGNLIEVLEYIEAGQKTGCLLVDTGKPFCLVYFNMGRIIYSATAGGLVGRDALYSILNLKEGEFRFILNKKPKAANTNLSTLEVLMSWTKELDETSRHGLRT